MKTKPISNIPNNILRAMCGGTPRVGKKVIYKGNTYIYTGGGIVEGWELFMNWRSL